MYYFTLLEIINEVKEEIDGQSLMNLFIEKYGSGNKINMNKALKKLRKEDKVNYRKSGRKIYYSKK